MLDRSVDGSLVRPMLTEIQSSVQELDELDAYDAVVTRTIDYLQPLGIAHIFAWKVPAKGASRRQQLNNILFNRFPEDWTKRYFSQNHIEFDPVVAAVRQGSESFFWKDLALPDVTAIYRSSLPGLPAYDLVNGYTFTLVGLSGDVFSFSLADHNLDIAQEHLREIRLIGTFAINRLMRLRELDELRLPYKITERERQIAGFLAVGLTEAQIADQLGITRHGVDKHTRSLREKFSANNITEAVVKALRLGLIS